jgi:hypothetical protein
MRLRFVEIAMPKELLAGLLLLPKLQSSQQIVIVEGPRIRRIASFSSQLKGRG